MSVPEYILDRRFEVLLLAVFDLDLAPKVLLPHEIKPFLDQHPPETVTAISHNALFDMPILAWKYGYVPGCMLDTLGMARALRSYKKNSLGAVVEQLFGHDAKGDTVHKVAGMHAQDIKNAGLWPELCSYAMMDARLCSFIYRKLIKEFSETEQKIQDLVLRAAVCPVLHVDMPLLQTHLDEIRKEKQRLLQDCGYERAALMSTAQFKTALEELGVLIKTKTSATDREIPAFAKTDDFMAELTEYQDADDATNLKVQTLAQARLCHKSTIEETRCQKFLNIARLPWGTWETPEDSLPAHLLPVPLRYGGAHTHRLSGEWGMNLQNLPRDKTKSKLRSALLAPSGYKLITADLAQIEARLVAQFCEQTVLVDAFRDGVDVYAGFASTVFGHPVHKQTDPHHRFIGKVGILSLGYGAGARRFYQMVTTQARQYGIPLEGLFDAQIAETTVNTYRTLFHYIPATWRKLDNLLYHVLMENGPTQGVQLGPVTILSKRIQLPNGLFLRYEGEAINNLWGGKLLENLCQALARVIIMQAAVRLADHGLRFVLQAHDELVFAVPDDLVEKSKIIIAEEMIRTPDWMPELPLAVEIGVGQNYGNCKT